ncbi:carrier protein YMC2 [Geopyxis carbonaria]|nr:carrier protein YMC2 [Geopyxis carbonaria]
MASDAREPQAYRGFVAGIFSGIAKLSVGHPFDTIKVRLQTSPHSRFSGPIDCLLQTVRREGLRGVYKGASPPLVGWMAMDSLMLGTLNLNRQLLKTHVFPHHERLPSWGHGIAGIGAGVVVSVIAAPIEHIKARLQVQYHGRAAPTPTPTPTHSASIAGPALAAGQARGMSTAAAISTTTPTSTAAAHKPRYTGPLDCTRQLYHSHGLAGIWRGLTATMIFRSGFFFWWSSYDLLQRSLTAHTSWSVPAVNFVAGGVSAQVFWIVAYPADVVKQRVMTSEGAPKRWVVAAREVMQQGGARGFWRGFTPCFLRAFPANAVALVVWEWVVRNLP